MREDTTTRRLALGGGVAPFLFVAVIAVAGFAYTGYSHIDQKISELGGREAENAIIQNVNFVAFGLVVVGLAWVLARIGDGWSAGPLLVAYFGLSGTIAQGLLPCDPGCEAETTTGLLHILTGLSGFIAATVAMFLLARRWRDDPRWSSHAAFSKTVGLVTAAGLVAFAISQAAGFDAIDGLVQRMMVSGLLVWIAGTGFKAYRLVAEDAARDAQHAVADR